MRKEGLSLNLLVCPSARPTTHAHAMQIVNESCKDQHKNDEALAQTLFAIRVMRCRNDVIFLTSQVELIVQTDKGSRDT